MERTAGWLARCALVALTGLECSGCFTGLMMLESERFRERCADDDDCVRMVAVEAVAEVGTALLVLGGAAIAAAVAADDGPDEAEEDTAQEEPAERPTQARRRHDYPDWP